MAKAGRKHQRHERASENGGTESSVQSGKQETWFQKLILQAHNFAEAGKLEEATTICSEVLNENPNRSEALFIAAYCLLKAERYGLAYCLMQRCVQICPDKQEVWNNLGLVAASLHLHEESVAYLKRSLKIKP